MTRAIIVDDEEHSIHRMSRMLEEYCAAEIHLMGTFDTVESGVEAIKRLRPDLVFLDVRIHDQTGFDLLAQFPNVDFEVIFTTAFEKYAVRAFKFSAIDYLLKPIDPDDLKRAAARVNEKISKDEISKKFEALFHNLKNIQGASKRISVPTMNGLIFLQLNEIIRLQSDGNYTHIYLKDKQKITVAKTLKDFEELLSDYEFCRVHNSHLINLAYVKSYNKGKGGFVSMADHSEIEVSTRRKEDFLKKLSGA